MARRSRPGARRDRNNPGRRPLFDVAGGLETLQTVRPAPGWRLGLTALAMAVVTAILIANLSVTAGWLAARLAVGGVLILALAIAFGSTTLVGLATVPMLAGATIGLDRPEGHAWGQTLLIGLLWYVTAELTWATIEARDTTVRSPAVHQLRIREVATVVAVTVVVGSTATVLATLAPVRTVLVRGLAVIAVLACVVAVGRVLARLIAPEPPATDPAGTGSGTGSGSDHEAEPGTEPGRDRTERKPDHVGNQDLQR